MIKLSILILAVAAGAAAPVLALADPAPAPAVPRMHKPSQHAKKHDVNGVGGAGTGSLKARATQPPGGK